MNVQKNYLQIQEEIAPYKPNIVAVTKYFDESAIVAAYNAGIRDFAESRVVEAIEKIKKLPDEIRKNSKFHFIGHLQTNKAKKVVENFDIIHSIDSLRLAKTVSEEAKKLNKVQDIFVEVNFANEEQKFGVTKEEIFDFIQKLKELPNLNIRGLMSMAPLGAEEKILDNLYKTVFDTKSELEQEFGFKMPDLSMGMSQDYQIAAKNGATMLRIGRKLFK